MSTTLLKKETLERKWYVIDAAGKPLGRTAVIPAAIAAAEVQAASEVAVIADKRRRPVETVATSVVGFRSVAIARSGEEDAVTVGAGDLVTVYAVLGYPSPGTLV